MPVESKGHGRSANHGHGHRPTDVTPVSRKAGVRGPTSNTKAAKVNQRPTLQPKKETKAVEEDERDATILLSGEERVVVTHDAADVVQVEHTAEVNAQEEDKAEQLAKVHKELPEQEVRPKYQKGADYKKSNITPDNFNVKEFNTNLTEFIRTLDDPRYSSVDEDYPVDELVKVVGMVSTSVKDYRSHAHNATVQLEDLREAMRNIKENLHFSVSRQAMDLRAGEYTDSWLVYDSHNVVGSVVGVLGGVFVGVIVGVGVAVVGGVFVVGVVCETALGCGYYLTTAKAVPLFSNGKR
ncbi:hypothetical protein RRG08_020362 [Elysia crispata]|uniref:Uncharacterized protein n=1 Tax=Elysia crispata TaxID=231223 RepID=A0AAE0Z7X7_9GAST|nr:hypothetical protein RRG08_020362 [Elysia crispata]